MPTIYSPPPPPGCTPPLIPPACPGKTAARFRSRARRAAQSPARAMQALDWPCRSRPRATTFMFPAIGPGAQPYAAHLSAARIPKRPSAPDLVYVHNFAVRTAPPCCPCLPDGDKSSSKTLKTWWSRSNRNFARRFERSFPAHTSNAATAGGHLQERPPGAVAPR